MQRKSKWVIVLALLVIAVLVVGTLVTAQTSKVPKPKEIKGTVIVKRPLNYEKGKYGGAFTTYDLGDPKTYNDTQVRDNTSSTLIARMAPSLMTVDYDNGRWSAYLGDEKKGKTGPGYTIETKADGTMDITAYLRQDLYWTDGTRLTADDFVFYWNDMVSSEDIGHSGIGNTVVTMPDGKDKPIVAEKIDRFTFKYKFPKAIGDPEIPISGGVMPKHLLEPIFKSKGAQGIIEFWGINTEPKKLLSYGPYVVESYRIGEGTTYKRNDKFFLKDKWNNRLPYLDKYNISIVPDLNGAVTKFLAGEIDTVGFPNAEFSRMVTESEKKGYTIWNGGPATGTLFICFNQNPNAERMKKNPNMLAWFQKKEFRQALNFMVNKQALVDQILNGLGEPDKGFIHPASIYFNPKNTFPNEYNPSKGVKLLESVGIRDRNGDKVLEDDKNKDIKFELVTNAGNTEREKAITIIANDWKAYGVVANPTTMDFNNLVDKLVSSFDWEAVVMGLTGGVWPSSAINVWPSDGNLHMWYPYQEKPATDWEAKMDKLFAEARNEPDFKKRNALWDELHAILYDQIPQILLFRRYSFNAVYNKWGNVNWDTLAPSGGDYNERLFLKK